MALQPREVHQAHQRAERGNVQHNRYLDPHHVPSTHHMERMIPHGHSYGRIYPRFHASWLQRVHTPIAYIPAWPLHRLPWLNWSDEEDFDEEDWEYDPAYPHHRRRKVHRRSKRRHDDDDRPRHNVHPNHPAHKTAHHPHKPEEHPHHLMHHPHVPGDRGRMWVH